MSAHRRYDSDNKRVPYSLMPPDYVRLTYGDNGPLTWTEDGHACSATYNADGTVATLTKGDRRATYTYSGGKVTNITVAKV